MEINKDTYCDKSILNSADQQHLMDNNQIHQTHN